MTLFTMGLTKWLHLNSSHRQHASVYLIPSKFSPVARSIRGRSSLPIFACQSFLHVSLFCKCGRRSKNLELRPGMSHFLASCVEFRPPTIGFNFTWPSWLDLASVCDHLLSVPSYQCRWKHIFRLACRTVSRCQFTVHDVFWYTNFINKLHYLGDYFLTCITILLNKTIYFVKWLLLLTIFWFKCFWLVS